MKKFDLLITGIGGQGVILASDIISDIAIDTGYDVKKTDTLGMAQRGGSVISNVRIARNVYSPLINEGDVDILLALEKLEAARCGHYLRSGGIVIVNNQSSPPWSVNIGNEAYPDDKKIANILKQQTDRVHFVNGTQHAKRLGNIRTLNIFMLGCISLVMPFKISVWKDNIFKHLPEKVHQINSTAFDQGRKEFRIAYL